jgi:hypothetical protein
MVLLTWTAVIGTGCVVTACLGAVLWESPAPAEQVVEFQTAHISRSGRSTTVFRLFAVSIGIGADWV